MSTLSRRRTGLLLLGAALTTGQTRAQGSGMGGSRRQRGEPSARCAPAPESTSVGVVSSEQLDYRLTGLQQDLQLTDSQIEIWQAFAESVKAYGALRVGQQHQPAPSAAATGGLAKIQQIVEAMQARQKALQTIEVSAHVLYGVLSDAQKVMADLGMADVVAIDQPPRPRL